MKTAEQLRLVYRGIFERMEKATPAERAFLFYEFCNKWCFDCGESFKTHKKDCKSPLLTYR